MRIRSAVATALLAVVLIGARQEPPGSGGPVLKAMQAELDRAFAKLKTSGESPLYYLCYRVYETESVSVSATYGAIDNQRRSEKSRTLDVELRVGNPKLDNTHKIRDEGWDPSDRYGRSGAPQMPVEDDETAIRNALWLTTDAHFKSAQKRYIKVKANKAVKVEEEDTSDDFSVEKAQVFTGRPPRSRSTGPAGRRDSASSR